MSSPARAADGRCRHGGHGVAGDEKLDPRLLHDATTVVGARERDAQAPRAIPDQVRVGVRSRSDGSRTAAP
jgi:hypothetical protein